MKHLQLGAPSGAGALVPSVVSMMLESIGWEIRTVEIDLVAGRSVLELHRFDGPWVHLSARLEGKVTIERWQRETVMSCGNDGVRGAPRNVIQDRFLGRTSCPGTRSALRVLSDYLVDNPEPGRAALPAATVRDAVRLLMT